MAVTTRPGVYIQHTAAADASTGRFRIQKIIWHSYTTATHTISVKDGAGNIVLPPVKCGTTTGAPIPFDFYYQPLSVDGLETDVLGSGTVIYILA